MTWQEHAVLADLSAEENNPEMEFIHRFLAGQYGMYDSWMQVPGMEYWNVCACSEPEPSIMIAGPAYTNYVSLHWSQESGWLNRIGSQGVEDDITPVHKEVITRVLRAFGVYKEW